MNAPDLTDRFVRHLRNTAKGAKVLSDNTKRPESDNAKRPENYGGDAVSASPKRGSPSPDPPVDSAAARKRKPSCNEYSDDNITALRQNKKLLREGNAAIARPKTKGIYNGGEGDAAIDRPKDPSTRGLEPSGQSTGGHVNRLQKQPETQPISQDQLIAEVKGIYSGLVTVESRCIDVDSAQTSLQDGQDAPKLTDDQWQALISLHRALLHEHHVFFLASQRPSTGPAFRRVASKYAMPSRMWRHDTHSFLELLRHRLPGSSEYMSSSIDSVYGMMALLHETVPAFEDTWAECLGDLSHYTMPIEGDDAHDRNVWMAVSQSRHSNAPGKPPARGRQRHHRAIPNRPNMAPVPPVSEQPHRRLDLSCFPPSVEAPEAQERDQGLLRARVTAQTMLGGAGDRPSAPEDWKLRGALWTGTAFPPDLESGIWDPLLPINPLSRNTASAPNISSTLLPTSRVALALFSTATGRAHGSPRGPKRQLLALSALILLASSPAAAALIGEQTEAALNALCTTMTFGSAVGVVGVSTYGPDVDPGWSISAYVCWAVSFAGAIVGALRRQPTPERRKALVCVTLVFAAHLYGSLFAQGSSPASNLVTFGPVVLVVSLFVATVLIDSSPAVQVVRATLGA